MHDPTGLIHLRARYYSPQQGRFLSVDPFEGMAKQPYSLHPYQYSYSNPVKFIDPTGQAPEAPSFFEGSTDPLDSMARAKKDCAKLLKEIERFTQLVKDRYNKQQEGNEAGGFENPGTYKGHKKAYLKAQNSLSDLLNDWEKSCKGSSLEGAEKVIKEAKEVLKWPFPPDLVNKFQLDPQAVEVGVTVGTSTVVGIGIGILALTGGGGSNFCNVH